MYCVGTREFNISVINIFLGNPFNLDVTCNSGDWYTARDECIANGGKLATVISKEMNDWITERAGQKDVWIAANDIDKEGTWTKVSGFVNWLDGEPNQHGDEDCAIIGNNGKWLDTHCKGHKPCYVCQGMYVIIIFKCSDKTVYKNRAKSLNRACYLF